MLSSLHGLDHSSLLVPIKGTKKHQARWIWSHRAPLCNSCQDCRVVGWGERNGNPLQCSCLENLRDGGAWCLGGDGGAAVYGVAQSQTWLKQLSSSSSNRVLEWPQRRPGLQGERPDDFFPHLPPNTTFQKSGREKCFPEKRERERCGNHFTVCQDTNSRRTSLAVQWLRLCASNAKGSNWSLVGELRCHMLHAAAAASARLLQSCLTLCNPIDRSPPGSPIPGILQARILEWDAITFSTHAV